MKKFKSGLFVAFMFILFGFFGCEKEGAKNEGAKNETFTVTWINYNGDVLEIDTDVEYGAMPTYDSTKPTRPGTVSHTYTFNGWSPEVVQVTADTTYTAQFSETLKKFTVKWINYNGVTLETDTDVEYEAMPTYDSAEPTRPEDAGHTYSFSGWSPEVVQVTADTTYTAQFSETLKKFTVKWINYNGVTLETDTDVEYGTTHTYNGAEPTKPNDGSFDYAFTGWSCNVSSSPNTIEYTALFGKIITTDAQLEQIYEFTSINGDTEWEIKYKKDSDHGFGTDLVLPSTYNGKTVTKISFEGFQYLDNKLTSVRISDSVTEIDGSAFFCCNKLKSVIIPNSVTSIGAHAFRNCGSLTLITIPNSVTSIDRHPFEDCSSLTSIMVEEGNSRYDSRNNCNAIILTSSNELIAGCNTTVIPTDVTSIGNRAFIGRSYLTSIAIPNSVTSIGEWAFCRCSSLTSIAIPNSVTKFGRVAFGGCSSLTSIVIPNSVTSIGGDAFNYCTALKIYAEATAKPAGWYYTWNSSSCPVYWYSETENTDGRHWHYVDGVPTVWK